MLTDYVTSGCYGVIEAVNFLLYVQAADKENPSSGWVISEGDIFLNGAQVCLPKESIKDCTFHPSEFYPKWTVEAPSESLKEILRHCTGWQSVRMLAEQIPGV